MSGSGIEMEFSLCGGAFDGGVVRHELKAPGATYLLKAESEPGRRQVWTYRFANRADAAGRWVLEADRYVGFQGMPGGKI